MNILSDFPASGRGSVCYKLIISRIRIAEMLMKANDYILAHEDDDSKILLSAGNWKLSFAVVKMVRLKTW